MISIFEIKSKTPVTAQKKSRDPSRYTFVMSAANAERITGYSFTSSASVKVGTLSTFPDNLPVMGGKLSLLAIQPILV